MFIPSRQQARPDCRVAGSKPLACFNQRHHFSIDGDASGVTPVSGLYGTSSPNAILWRIWSVVISPLYLSARRTFTHVGYKVLGLLPSFADFDPSAAIGRIALRIGIGTPIYNGAPNSIDFVVAHAVRSICFPYAGHGFDLQASAAFCIARTNIVCFGDHLCSAITAERPHPSHATATVTDGGQSANGNKPGISMTDCHWGKFNGMGIGSSGHGALLGWG